MATPEPDLKADAAYYASEIEKSPREYGQPPRKPAPPKKTNPAAQRKMAEMLRATGRAVKSVTEK